jgi:polyhydroxybutyrate depolymerase
VRPEGYWPLLAEKSRLRTATSTTGWIVRHLFGFMARDVRGKRLGPSKLYLVCKCVVLLLAFAGCDRSQTASLAARVGDRLIVPAAQIHQPSGLVPGERRPLLIFLHGLGSSGKAAFDVLHLTTFAERERVFVLAPDGSVDQQRRPFWNAGAACCNFDRRPIDDVARLTQLIDVWRARPDIDSSRIYVMGHSNGGFMTERLACALGDRIAAAASISGAAPASDQACTPTQRLALLEVHGDADEIVPYSGGRVFDSSELAPFPGAQQGFRDWGKRLSCAGTPQPAADRDLDARLPGSETRVEQYASCASGSVELWTMRGGDHYVGMKQQAFEAIWQFLSAHHS